MTESLEDRFWALAQTQTAGFGFAADCEAMTRSFIQQGILKLTSVDSGPTNLRFTKQKAICLDSSIQWSTRRCAAV
jgi:hypothetical protein